VPRIRKCGYHSAYSHLRTLLPSVHPHPNLDPNIPNTKSYPNLKLFNEYAGDIRIASYRKQTKPETINSTIYVCGCKCEYHTHEYKHFL